jgi:hypothetical protein
MQPYFVRYTGTVLYPGSGTRYSCTVPVQDDSGVLRFGRTGGGGGTAGTGKHHLTVQNAYRFAPEDGRRTGRRSGERRCVERSVESLGGEGSLGIEGGGAGAGVGPAVG